MKNPKVAVVGGGAAGFFAAITCKKNYPDAEVSLYEKTPKVLTKVKVSGGGRCNLTNATTHITDFSKAYPRGSKAMKKLLKEFSPQDTVQWFERHGLSLYAQADQRMFPTTNNSQSVIDLFLQLTQSLHIKIHTRKTLTRLQPKADSGFELHFSGNEMVHADKVILTMGGQPKQKGFEPLKPTNHTIVPPVPSLFTFNMPDEKTADLMGVSVPEVMLRITGTKLKSEGALLMTHWGVSGPAVLKLSAIGARSLEEKGYRFQVQVNWCNKPDEMAFREEFARNLAVMKKRKVGNKNPFQLPERLWLFLLEKKGISPDMKWGDLGKKRWNQLIATLLNDTYEVSGKTTFKEEFVTCGGIDLSEVNLKSMESKKCKSLYFAGEVLNIDGITGGFNFQSAWTTAYVAGQLRG